MKIVVISPHRDDAAFSLSLTIAAWLKYGHSVTILNCFTLSSYAPFWHEESDEPLDRVNVVSALRADEDALWMCAFDGQRLNMIDLALEDAPLRLQCMESEVCGFPMDRSDRSISAVQIAIAVSNPVVLVSPLALGGHVDHVVAREAAEEASVKYNIPIAFYEDLPYATRAGAEVELEVIAAARRFDLEPGFVESSTSAPVSFAQKLRLALIYRSQIDHGVAHDIANMCLRYKGRERLWLSREWRDIAWASDRLSKASMAI